jgi:hypothetical protein
MKRLAIMANTLQPDTSTLKVELLHPNDLEKAVKFLLQNFMKRDPLVRHLQIPEEEYEIYIRAYTKRSLEDDLALVIKEKDTANFILVHIIIDGYKEVMNPYDLHKDLPPTSKIFEIEQLSVHLGAFETFKPSRPYEVVFGCFAAINPKYGRLNLLEHVHKFLFEEHPHRSKISIALGEAMFVVSQKAFLRVNYKVLSTFKINDYRNKDGINPYEGYEKTAEQMGLPMFDSIWLMGFIAKPLKS